MLTEEGRQEEISKTLVLIPNIKMQEVLFSQLSVGENSFWPTYKNREQESLLGKVCWLKGKDRSASNN